MVANFLRAEINSSHFAENIPSILERDRADRTIIDNPDVNDAQTNRYRAALLEDFREYKRNEKLFAGFRMRLSGIEFSLDHGDLMNFRYMNYSYRIDLSGGSRLVADAVKRVVEGEIGKETADWIRAAASAVKQGVSFPELILVSQNKETDPIILEGHLRATAYLFNPDYLPPELTGI